VIFGRRRRAPGNVLPEPESVHHASMTLPVFIERLERRPAAHLLDVGPVCGENIPFFSKFVGKLFICDMFLQLDKALRKGLPPDRIWRHLDYPSQSFDGILLWDLPDRLEDPDLDRLVELCLNLLRSEGMVVIFSHGEQESPGAVDSFVMGENFKFQQRRRTHLRLPIHRRENRDILAVFAFFDPLNSYIHRTGLREFLFQIEKKGKPGVA
jgi:hypothetical protein